jgi:NDP-sugar pyrophosphorylase family protein
VNGRLVILAAGLSSRMKKEGGAAAAIDAALMRDAGVKSKSMLGVGPGGRPFLDYLLWNAREAGYADVVIVVGEDSGGARERYGSAPRGNEYHGVRISYAVQRISPGRTKPAGTADALLSALLARTDWRGTDFTVCNSDNLYSRGALAALLETVHPGAMIDYDLGALCGGGAAGAATTSRATQFAVIEKDREGYLRAIIEKPSPEELSRVRDVSGRVGVSMNVFRFPYDRVIRFLEEVPLHPLRGEKELPAAVSLMIRSDPHAIMTIPASEEVPDLTERGDIAHVQEFLRDNYPPAPF